MSAAEIDRLRAALRIAEARATVNGDAADFWRVTAGEAAQTMGRAVCRVDEIRKLLARVSIARGKALTDGLRAVDLELVQLRVMMEGTP